MRLLWLSKYIPNLITIQTRFVNKEISCSSASLQSLPFYVSGNKVGFFTIGFIFSYYQRDDDDIIGIT